MNYDEAKLYLEHTSYDDFNLEEHQINNRLDAIKTILKENQQLKIQITAREEEYRKLEDNWNKLKEYVEKGYNNGERIDTKEIKDKMRELETRCK